MDTKRTHTPEATRGRCAPRGPRPATRRTVGSTCIPHWRELMAQRRTMVGCKGAVKQGIREALIFNANHKSLKAGTPSASCTGALS